VFTNELLQGEGNPKHGAMAPKEEFCQKRGIGIQLLLFQALLGNSQDSFIVLLGIVIPLGGGYYLFFILLTYYFLYLSYIHH
jgi:hypothetical protein